MNRYPGNHMDSGIVTVPRELKTRPGAPQTHLAYITGDEAQMLQEHKPGTPHKGPHDIPNYDSWDWMSSDSSSSSSGSSGPHGNGGGNYSDPWVDNYSTPTTDNRPDPIYVPTPEESNWANEFANTPTVIQESEDDYYEEGPAWWDAPAGTDDPINYVPWQTSDEDNFISAYGGLGIYGDGDDHLWNPFIAGYDPETGEPIYLTTSQFNEMMSVGEFGILPSGGTTTGGAGGGGGHGWGGWGSSNLNYGNRSGYGKYANWANRPFMEQSFDSPMPQYYASLKNPGQPINQRLFMDMVAGMNKGGIMGVRK